MYHHRNLPVHEFILEMSESSPDNPLFEPYIESIPVLDKEIQALLTNMSVKKFDFSVPHYALDPSLVFRAEFLTDLYLSNVMFIISATTSTNDHYHGQPLFKGLKRLSLCQVLVSEETFVRIMLSCPLIEYLYVSDCEGLTTIPETIFQASSLIELHLTGCELTSTSGSNRPLLIKGLKTLSLDHVFITKDNLEEIMCSCPLIERVVLSDCVGLTNIQLIQSVDNNYPHGICLNWYGHDKYFFPRLKSLYINNVELSAELFESFSSNFPSLEDLELRRCYGFSEIQITISSIKRLVINTVSTERMVITIYAPNINCFELFVRALPVLIFHTESAREWKSHVDVFSNDEVLLLPWLLQLRELLNSLRGSQISLDVFPNPFKDLKVENTSDVVFCNPVPLHRVCLTGDGYQSSLFPDLLDCLLLICRPRYIGVMNWYITNSETGSKKRRNKLAVFIISVIIRNPGEMSRGYLWERELEEVSMQVWYEKSKGWRNVRVEGTRFPRFRSSDTKIRFQLKWRLGD